MQYLERTLQVRAALLEQPQTLKVIRSVFERVVTRKESATGSGYWVGSGSSRDAFQVGVCIVDGVGEVSVLLKIFNQRHEDSGRTWESACGRPYARLGQGVAEEYGAFEVYYDFVAGNIPHVSFSSKRKFNEFNTDMRNPQLRQQNMHISLNKWDGTRVDVGDFGALPYFQMAVKWGKYFGWLTEGTPPVIEPKWTAHHNGADENNIEQGRIIDLSAHHCTLREINRERPFGEDHRDYLGLIKRGRKYLLQANRLDL